MKINSDSSNNEPHIELVPLIDVIFCILTFFLLAGLQVAKQQAISVDIPSASTGKPTARELLMVSLNDAGQIFLEQQPMLAPAQLTDAVKQYTQARPNSAIVLYASKQVSYNRVVEILDALRSVAGNRVALATIPITTAAPTPPIITNPYSPYNPYQGSTPPTNITPSPTTTQPSAGVAPTTGQTTPPTQVTPSPATSAVPATSPSPTPSKSPTP
jgi:biopolymer transport protein ExbD